MKKLSIYLSALFILSLFVFSCSPNNDESGENNGMQKSQISYDQTTYGAIINESSGPKIGGVWYIGRKTKNCASGLGICKLKEITLTFPPIVVTIPVNNQFVSTVDVINPNEFVAEIDEETKNQFVDFYGGSYLVLKEDFIMDSKNSSAFGLANNFTISAGVYNFEQTKNGSYKTIISNSNVN